MEFIDAVRKRNQICNYFSKHKTCDQCPFFELIDKDFDAYNCPNLLIMFPEKVSEILERSN